VIQKNPITSRNDDMPAIVTAVSRSASHTFSKPNEPMIRLAS
jgi:hypothetical protein